MALISSHKKLDEVLTYLNTIYHQKASSNEISPLPDEVWKSREEILTEYIDEIKTKAGTKVLNRYSFQDQLMSAELLYNIDLILEFLLEDKMIKKDGEKHAIRWKGRVFIEEGGYVGKASRDALEEKRKSRNDILIRRFSRWAAFGTVGLLVFEIYKFMFANHIVFTCP